MNLYELTTDIQSIFSHTSEEGELNDETIVKLDELNEQFEIKAVNIASYIKNLEAESLAIMSAIMSMSDRKKKIENKIQSLSDYLQENLQRLDIKEIGSSPYFKIKLKQCPPSIDVYNEELIPSEFWREKIVVSIDKIKIKEIIKEGIDVPGATLENKIKLEIK